MTTSTTSKPIYVIQPRAESGVTAKPRLVRAARLSAAENFALGAFEIARATPEQCVDLGAQGVVIENAGE